MGLGVGSHNERVPPMNVFCVNVNVAVVRAPDRSDSAKQADITFPVIAQSEGTARPAQETGCLAPV